MTRAVLVIGSNLGDRLEFLRGAVAGLKTRDHITVLECSPVYETAPVGGPEQGHFLNAVVIVEVTCTANRLLEECVALESEARRVREERWGPRTLDVDVITYGNVESDDPHLTLPHPRAHLRAFVLRPWAAIDSDARLLDPRIGANRFVRELADEADDARDVVRVDGALEG